MITALEIWLLGVALAMDCFSICVAQGLKARHFIWRPMTYTTLSFGIFQGGMTVLGYAGTAWINNYLPRLDIVATLLLLFLGGKMIWEGLKEEKDADEPDLRMLQPLNIIALSVATSIDALAVGISFTCMQDVTWLTVLHAAFVIGLCATLFSIAGLCIGIKAGQHLKFRTELLGGIILIGIGIKIFIEHYI